MSIDIVVTENSELSEVAAAPQEGVRDLPAQRGPYLVPFGIPNGTWYLGFPFLGVYLRYEDGMDDHLPIS